MKSTYTVRVQVIFFSITSGKLMVFLPHHEIPTSELYEGVSLDEAVQKLVQTSVNLSLKDGFVEQLYTISHTVVKIHTITVVYYMLVAGHKIPADHMRVWVKSSDVLKRFPYSSTLEYAMQRVRWKIEYTNVAYSLLPDEFVIGELQHVYEAILGKPMDKRNFRKKIFSLNLLKDIGKKRAHGRARPAELYAFKERKPAIVEIL